MISGVSIRKVFFFKTSEMVKQNVENRFQSDSLCRASKDHKITIKISTSVRSPKFVEYISKSNVNHTIIRSNSSRSRKNRVTKHYSFDFPTADDSPSNQRDYLLWFYSMIFRTRNRKKPYLDPTKYRLIIIFYPENRYKYERTVRSKKMITSLPNKYIPRYALTTD